MPATRMLQNNTCVMDFLCMALQLWKTSTWNDHIQNVCRERMEHTTLNFSSFLLLFLLFWIIFIHLLLFLFFHILGTFPTNSVLDSSATLYKLNELEESRRCLKSANSHFQVALFFLRSFNLLNPEVHVYFSGQSTPVNPIADRNMNTSCVIFHFKEQCSRWLIVFSKVWPDACVYRQTEVMKANNIN